MLKMYLITIKVPNEEPVIFCFDTEEKRQEFLDHTKKKYGNKLNYFISVEAVDILEIFEGKEQWKEQ